MVIILLSLFVDITKRTFSGAHQLSHCDGSAARVANINDSVQCGVRLGKIVREDASTGDHVLAIGKA